MLRSNSFLRRVVLTGMAAVLACAAQAAPKKADKKAEVKAVDSGSFGIYVNGRRVATESFDIRQHPDGSITRSEIKLEDGISKVSQTSELEMTPTGDLRRYKWSESGPEKAYTIVQPENEFLVEHVYSGSNEKPLDQPFILPASTMILDDYFFVQRQVLAWRYLAAGCHPAPGQQGCRLAKAQFGVLVPRQRASALVSMEYVGREKVVVKGAERELNRFKLESDGSEWGLWFDDQHRLVRVIIAAQNTEVLRD